MGRNAILVLIATSLLLGAGAAAAADFGDRVDRRFDRIGEHREHQLDRRGDRIDHRLDRRVARANTCTPIPGKLGEMRTLFQKMRTMTPEQRHALRKQWHAMTPEQRKAWMQANPSASDRP